MLDRTASALITSSTGIRAIHSLLMGDEYVHVMSVDFQIGDPCLHEIDNGVWALPRISITHE
jgi:hypothetical protein